MAEQRIQKVLSDQGVCSRRAAEKLIDEGRVKVNGHPVTLGDKMDPDFDKVSIDGKSVRIVRKRQYTYLMLNKPRGYITTASDERGRKTVMDLLTGVDRRVYPIGRLDKDSEGLLLLTDDGAFANLLTHPSGGVGKLYRVTVRPRATEEQVVLDVAVEALVELLVHHRDAVLKGILGSGEGDLLAVEPDGPLVLLIGAEQALHQSRFSCAVRTDHTVAVALDKFNIDIFK